MHLRKVIPAGSIIDAFGRASLAELYKMRGRCEHSLTLTVTFAIDSDHDPDEHTQSILGEHPSTAISHLLTITGSNTRECDVVEIIGITKANYGQPGREFIATVSNSWVAYTEAQHIMPVSGRADIYAK